MTGFDPFINNTPAPNLTISSKHAPAILTALPILLLAAGIIFADELGELQWTEDEAGGTFVVRDPYQAWLIVYTTVVPLGFDANMGIVRVEEPARGEYRVLLNAGTNIVTIRNNDYLPLRDRFYIPAKKALVIRVEPKRAPVENAGRGHLRIETTPAGSAVAIDGLPAPGLTPVTVEHQLAGVRYLSFAKTGYRDLDTTVRIAPDSTTVVKISLARLAATLKVETQPSGASVYLDGDLLGTTPVERSDLAPGEKTVVVMLEGFETATRQVRLAPDEPRAERIDLFRQTGSAVISCDVSGAELFLDGAALGSYEGAPVTRDKLALGDHIAAASAEGYEDAEVRFRVEYNKPAPVTLKLRAKPGALFVVTTPEGAEIWLDGRSTGRKSPAKIENLVAGEHKLRLKLDGYGDVEKTVSVPAGKTGTVSELMTTVSEATPYAVDSDYGEINVQSYPLNAIIYLNGRELYSRTPTKFKVAPGKYSIRIEFKGYQTYISDVEVSSGLTKTVAAVLTPSNTKAKQTPSVAGNISFVMLFFIVLTIAYRTFG